MIFTVIKICYPIFILALFSSCDFGDNKIQNVLNQSRSNKKNLKSIFNILSKKNDSIAKAGKFILSNIPSHYHISQQREINLVDIYNSHVSISQKYDWQITEEWGMEIDSLKDCFLSTNFQQSDFYLGDIETITPGYLINQIELAFTAWKSNPYHKSVSFEDFCEYILPYKPLDGLLLEDIRHELYENNKDILSRDYSTFQEAADSLLYRYKDVKHNMFYGASIPIYSFHTLSKIKRGLCKERCWFNSYLFSSLGFPITIDFVPYWGNRENNHIWNSLYIDGETHPFEPYWEVDRWKYKKIYNNVAVDHRFGKFRLPKVFNILTL